MIRAERVCVARKLPVVYLFPLIVFMTGCSQSYPYLFLTDNCRCEVYTHRDTRNKLEIQFKAEYEVDDRIITNVEIEFRNNSADTLSLQQAHIKGASRNIRYQYNDRWVPLPYITVPPRETYTAVFQGGDTELVDDPWLKIAGERTRLEIKGLILGKKELESIRVELMPTNPKLSL